MVWMQIHMLRIQDVSPLWLAALKTEFPRLHAAGAGGALSGVIRRHRVPAPYHPARRADD